jgi:hypothetical protein
LQSREQALLRERRARADCQQAEEQDDRKTAHGSTSFMTTQDGHADG